MLSKLYLYKDLKYYVLRNNNISYIFICLNRRKVFFLLNNHLYINKTFQIISFFNKFKLNLKFINFFFFSWSVNLIKKIKVRHKISWLKIFRFNYFLIKINFGFSYNICFFLNNIFLKKKKKFLTSNKLIFKSFSLHEIFKITSTIKNIQPINQYSLRGFRFSQQKFIKRVGKISKYNEFKIKIL